jgi:hypothetical protein
MVLVWGKVTYVDNAGHYYYLDDGSGLDDGSDHAGVRVLDIFNQLPAVNGYVITPGVSSCYMSNGNLRRLVRVVGEL